MADDHITASSEPIDLASIEESPPFDFTFKILLVGDSNVGKTSFINRYTQDNFDENYSPSVEVDIQHKTIRYQNKVIKLQFWDTAGQERYKTFISAYFRGAVGVILVYDITKLDSFVHLEEWINFVKANCWTNTQFILTGTKIDQNDYREVSEEECKSMAQRFSIPIVECSSKTGINVNAAVMFLVKHIFIKLGSVLTAETELLKSILGMQLENENVFKYKKTNKKCQPCLK